MIEGCELEGKEDSLVHTSMASRTHLSRARASQKEQRVSHTSNSNSGWSIQTKYTHSHTHTLTHSLTLTWLLDDSDVSKPQRATHKHVHTLAHSQGQVKKESKEDMVEKWSRVTTTTMTIKTNR